MSARVAAVAAALAAAAAAAVLVLLLLPAGGRARPVRPLTARATLTPGTHLFADDVDARLEVVADRRKLDPAHAELRTAFAPYEVVRSHASRRVGGGTVDLVWDLTLRCLTAKCMPKGLQEPGGASSLAVGAAAENAPHRGDRRTFRFRAARVRYVDPSTRKRATIVVPWRPLQVVSRLNDAEVSNEFPFRSGAAPLPAVSWRIDPTLLVALLAAALVLVLCVPGAIALRHARRRWGARVERSPWAGLPPLERAFALLDWARVRGDAAARRKALEVLGDELERRGEHELAASARALAWSSAAPAPEETGRLASRVREAVRAA